MGSLSPLPPSSPTLKALTELRDRLGHYLATIENNGKATSQWLSDNAQMIALQHRLLLKAIESKDAKSTAFIFARMPPHIRAFVLCIDDITGKAREAFGADSAVVKAFESTSRDWQSSLLVKAYPVTASDIETLKRADQELLYEIQERRKGNLLSALDDLRHRDERKREEEMRQLQEKLRQIKQELLTLQGENHYYIDSMLQWVGTLLEPEEGTVPDAETQLRYLDPDFLIARAEEDFAEVSAKKAKAATTFALRYNEVADVFEKSSVEEKLATFKQLYSQSASNEDLQIRAIMAEEYRFASPVDYALTRLRNRKDQELILSWALDPQNNIAIAFSNVMTVNIIKTPADTLRAFISLAVDTAEPLSPAVLSALISRIAYDDLDKSELEHMNIACKTGLQSMAARFTDLEERRTAMAAILEHMDNFPAAALDHYITFCDGWKSKDAAKAKAAIDAAIADKVVGSFFKLLTNCHPSMFFMSTLLHISDVPEEKAALIESAIAADLLGEARGAAHLNPLIESHILPAIDRISPNTVRRLISYALPQEERSYLRNWLEEKWLARIVSHPTAETNAKLSWIAALLEPFDGNIRRANIINAAALSARDATTMATLQDLETGLIGHNVRLDDDRLLAKVGDIANIWYNESSRMLSYTVEGASQIITEGLQPQDAQEILALLRRRTGMLPEKDGLFNPINIDAFHHTRVGTSIGWYNTSAALNINSALRYPLADRDDFLHVIDRKNGDVTSFNVRSICLMRELENGSILIIDKYGVATVMEGSIKLPKPAQSSIAGNIYFNPAHASILRINDKDKKIEFRVEGVAFDKFLAQTDEEFFHTIGNFTDAEFAQLKQIIKSNDNIVTPGGTLENLYFNMQSLGYLAFSQDKNSAGFFCHRYAPSKKQGFISVDAAMAADVLKGLSKNKNILRVGDIVMHKPSVDDAYYNAARRSAQFLIGGDVLDVPCSAHVIAQTVLKELAAEKKSFVAATTDGAPADVVRIGDATLLTVAGGQERVYVTTKQTPFHIYMPQAEGRTLLDKIEAEGKNTLQLPENKWTRGIVDALRSLEPPQNTAPAPAVATHVKKELPKKHKPTISRTY